MSEITGYWTEDIWVDSCSVCCQKKQRTVNLHFNHQELRFCESCAVALREIIATMTKDVKPEKQ